MIGAGWDAMLDLTNMIKRFLALPLLLVGSSGLCGELQLGNGARIPGELKRIEATKVVWSAELIGDISINKSDVVAMHTGTRSDLDTAAGEVLRDCGRHRGLDRKPRPRCG